MKNTWMNMSVLALSLSAITTTLYAEEQASAEAAVEEQAQVDAAGAAALEVVVAVLHVDMATFGALPGDDVDHAGHGVRAVDRRSAVAQDFDAVHKLLERFYRVILIDTGNNMRAENWLAAAGARWGVDAAHRARHGAILPRDLGRRGQAQRRGARPPLGQHLRGRARDRLRRRRHHTVDHGAARRGPRAGRRAHQEPRRQGRRLRAR